MCAIAGVFCRDKNCDIRELELMCERMKFRGPDNRGIFAEESVGLGHCRLSIIDLELGNQPMYNYDRSRVICLTVKFIILES